MPYIIQADRKEFDPAIGELMNKLINNGFSKLTPGNMNYVISKMLWSYFDANPSYTLGNEMMGMLECVKQEFYRRKLAPYENQKIKNNGDI